MISHIISQERKDSNYSSDYEVFKPHLHNIRDPDRRCRHHKGSETEKICIFVMFNVRKPSFGEEPPEHRPGSLRQMLQGDGKTKQNMKCTLHETKH